MPIDRPALTRFCHDERGAVAIIVALVLTALIGFVAIGVDVGLLYRSQSSLQANADLAAVSAVVAPDAARQRAEAVTGRNAPAASTVTALDHGRFLADPALTPEDRFQARPIGASDANAVRVALEHQTALGFAGSFLGVDSVTQRASALAMQPRGASFSLASGLLRLDRGVINALLERTLGSGVALDVLDHQALLDGRVTLLSLVEALATEARIVSGNYRDILATEVQLPTLLRSIARTQTGVAAATLDRLAMASGAEVLRLENLVSVPDPALGVTVPDFLDYTEVSALDLLAASLETVTAARAIDLDLSLTLPGLLGVDTWLLVQERPARSGWVAVGETGATLHTAQTRLGLDVALSPTLLGVLGAGVVPLELEVPLYLELANARATLTELNCRPQTPGDTVAVFQTGSGLQGTAAGPHLAEIFLGSFPEAAALGPAGLRREDLGFADLLTVEIRLLFIRIAALTIQARAHAVLGESSVDQTEFTLAQLNEGRAQATVGSGDLLGSLVSSLLADDSLELRVKPAQQGLVTGLVSGLVDTLISILPTRLLSRLAGPLDLVLNETLRVAGLQVGRAELELHDTLCLPPRLVQ